MNEEIFKDKQNLDLEINEYHHFINSWNFRTTLEGPPHPYFNVCLLPLSASTFYMTPKHLNHDRTRRTENPFHIAIFQCISEGHFSHHIYYNIIVQYNVIIDILERHQSCDRALLDRATSK